MESTHEPPRAPRGLKTRARELWRRTVRDYELSEAELVLLAEACRVVDVIADLQKIIDTDGYMSSSSQGLRTHPAVVEQRQQRLILARLTRELRLPVNGAPDMDEGIRLIDGGNAHGAA